MNVGLSHFKRQPFIKGVAKQETVNKSSVDARYANNAATPDRRNTLTQRFTAAALQFQVSQHRFRGAAFRFKTDVVYYCIHAPVTCRLFNN